MIALTIQNAKLLLTCKLLKELSAFKKCAKARLCHGSADGSFRRPSNPLRPLGRSARSFIKATGRAPLRHELTGARRSLASLPSKSRILLLPALVLGQKMPECPGYHRREQPPTTHRPCFGSVRTTQQLNHSVEAVS